MARNPTVWWRESHGSYYTTINGRQIRLDPDRKKADAAFHRLMLSRATGPARRLRVEVLTQLWLEDLERRVARESFLHWRQFGRRWVKAFGRSYAGDVRPYNVTAWIDQQESWGPTTRGLAARAIKACYKWGVDQGFLDRSPLDRLRVGKLARRSPVSEADLARWLAAVECEATRDWVAVALATGCRPGELATLEAASVSRDGRSCVVRGKAGKRTVPLSDATRAVLARLAASRPDGPLLRTKTGRKWSRTMLHRAFRVVSKRAGVKVVPYHLRGVFATRSLRVNGEILTAKLLGHSGLAMLATHYEGLDHDDLRAAMERISPGG